MECAVWMELLKSLTGPIIAVAAVIVSSQQVGINRIKLRVDMYEKRLAVYEQVRSLLGAFGREGTLTSDDLGNFRNHTAQAVFLCPGIAVSYIAELDRRAVALIKAHHRRDLVLNGLSNRDISEIDNEIDDLENWFFEAPASAVQAFKSALELEDPGPMWLTKVWRRCGSAIRPRHATRAKKSNQR